MADCWNVWGRMVASPSSSQLHSTTVGRCFGRRNGHGHSSIGFQRRDHRFWSSKPLNQTSIFKGSFELIGTMKKKNLDGDFIRVPKNAIPYRPWKLWPWSKVHIRNMIANKLRQFSVMDNSQIHMFFAFCILCVRKILDTPIDISCWPRTYLPSSRGLSGSLSTASMSFCQLQLLAASQLDPSCQLLFIYFARFFVVLKPESKNQNLKFCH